MTERYNPVEPDGTVRGSEDRTGFMLRCLLATRTDIGLPSDDDGSEQDVNIYLARLLSAYADPRYCMRVGNYIAAHDSVVFEKVQHSPSKRFRYSVYRINADHLLMAIGVFANPRGRRPDSRPAVLRSDDSAHVGRAKTYYDFASTYSQCVFGRTSGVADVLGKLAAGFERYVRILATMRGEYLGFVGRLSEGEIYHLERAAQHEGLEALRDEFLDRFSEWKRTGTTEAHQRLVAVVERLQRADPDFRVDAIQ
jgi:hypothetical protein